MASSAAKVVNLSTNAAALAYFLPSGHVLWGIGLGMAACNILGATLGARLALRHGSGFVRGTFILVAAVLIARLKHAAQDRALGADELALKSRIMHRILANDAEVRNLAEPWIQDLSRMVGGSTDPRQMH